MAEYATETQLRQRIPKAGNAPDVSTQLLEILEAASRAIDHYVGVEDNYFAPASAPSSKVIWGRGNSFLDLPTFVFGTVTVSAPSGVSVPNFLVSEKRIYNLTEDGRRSPYAVWAQGVPFTVSGTWGFVTTPADIREACLQVSVRWWRGKDEAFSGVIGGLQKDGQIIERDLPAPVRTILGRWRTKSKRVHIA